MGFLRRIAGFLGLARDEIREEEEDRNNNNNNTSTQDRNFNHNNVNYQETGQPRRGFSVPVQVPVERPNLGPVLVPCDSGDGGVQGLKWYAKRMRIDEDGDVAHEFLDEVLPETPARTEEQERPMPRFEVRYRTRPAIVKNQIMTPDGKIQHFVEYEGKLRLV